MNTREAEFLSDLEVRKIGETTWLLLRELKFYSAELRGVIIAPAGMQTNFASIPRFAFALFPPIGWYDYAAVIHDGGYINALYNGNGERIFTVKKVIDKLFLEAMLATDVRPIVAQTMYQAVHRFGKPQGHPLAQNARYIRENYPDRRLNFGGFEGSFDDSI